MTADDPRAPLDVDLLRRDLLRPAGPLARLDVVPEAASTHLDLVARARAGTDDVPALLVAEHQTAGRGRAGRSWETPRGAALAASFLVRPDVPATALGWVPLATGLAVVRALAAAGVEARVKWPNDVLLPAADEIAGFGGFRKVAGVLAEAVPGARGLAVVLGVGLNVDQRSGELPVPTATSLRLAAAPDVPVPTRDGLLVALAGEVVGVLARLEASGGDAVAAGVAGEYAAASATLGTRVRVELAGGTETLEGTAVGLAGDGSLVVATADGERVVSAGDVHHLRRADDGTSASPS